MFLIIDCETTGLPSTRTARPTDLDAYKSARIIEFAYVLYDSEVKEKFEMLIKPDGFPVRGTEFHGITSDMLAEKGVPISELFAKLESIEYDTIVSHNIDFDLRVLLSELHRYGKTELYKQISKKKTFCTMITGTAYMRQERYVSLVNLRKKLGLSGSQQHRALPDAIACLECFEKLRNYSEPSSVKISALSGQLSELNISYTE